MEVLPHTKHMCKYNNNNKKIQYICFVITVFFFVLFKKRHCMKRSVVQRIQKDMQQQILTFIVFLYEIYNKNSTSIIFFFQYIMWVQNKYSALSCFYFDSDENMNGQTRHIYIEKDIICVQEKIKRKTYFLSIFQKIMLNFCMISYYCYFLGRHIPNHILLIPERS